MMSVVAVVALTAGCSQDNKTNDNTMRLLYWNIQNGMWDGQPDNYDRFVAWVNKQNPDICVWCESRSRYISNSDQKMDPEDAYLPDNWGELAARYGHSYWYKGGDRDGFPQVITAKFPIENVDRIIGNEADSVVTHGCGWATIEKNGHKINVVTLHTWPQRYGFNVSEEDREADAAADGGHHYRRMEIEYICRHTIETVPDAANQMWMMMGDFNSQSEVDNWVYGYPEDDARLLVHNYVLHNTPYIDVIHERNPNNFYTSTSKRSRIDFVYCTQPLFERVTDARIVEDAYTHPVRDGQFRQFCHPSDHLPLIVDFDLTK